MREERHKRTTKSEKALRPQKAPPPKKKTHRPALPAAAVDGLLLDRRGRDGVDDLGCFFLIVGVERRSAKNIEKATRGQIGRVLRPQSAEESTAALNFYIRGIERTFLRFSNKQKAEWRNTYFAASSEANCNCALRKKTREGKKSHDDESITFGEALSTVLLICAPSAARAMTQLRRGATESGERSARAFMV
jgi:hypothetical protein